jgi:hypothetical protein
MGPYQDLSDRSNASFAGLVAAGQLSRDFRKITARSQATAAAVSS